MVQTKSVGQYVAAFCNVVLELGNGAPDEQNLLFQFVEGLKPNIRTQVLVARPKKLSDAMQIAEHTDTAVYLGSTQRNGVSGIGGHAPMELGQATKRGGSKRSVTPRTPLQTYGEGSVNVVCWYCDKKGHVQRDCYKRQKDQGKRSNTPPRSSDRKGKSPLHKQRGQQYNPCDKFKGAHLHAAIDSGCDSDNDSGFESTHLPKN